MINYIKWKDYFMYQLTTDCKSISQMLYTFCIKWHLMYVNIHYMVHVQLLYEPCLNIGKVADWGNICLSSFLIHSFYLSPSPSLSFTHGFWLSLFFFYYTLSFLFFSLSFSPSLFLSLSCCVLLYRFLNKAHF